MEVPGIHVANAHRMSPVTRYDALQCAALLARHVRAVTDRPKVTDSNASTCIYNDCCVGQDQDGVARLTCCSMAVVQRCEVGRRDETAHIAWL